jgi:hypothetical protein
MQFIDAYCNDSDIDRALKTKCSTGCTSVMCSILLNITHELQGTGMTNKRISLGYMIAFCDLHFTYVQ